MRLVWQIAILWKACLAKGNDFPGARQVVMSQLPPDKRHLDRRFGGMLRAKGEWSLIG
jgi:hypothetical protein